MGESLLQFRNLGVVGVAHGDIFLQDIREYRERNLARVGLRGIFPLWHQDTAELVKEFMRLGFKAYLSCVEGKLGPEFAGRRLDENLVQSLPAGTDPCGENGEFHSFVHDGPIFQRAVAVKVGETVCRDDRYYADLLPVDVPNSTPSPEALSQERTR